MDQCPPETLAYADKYRQMIDNASDAILTIDFETGRILSANPKAVEMTGYSEPELTARHVWDLHPEEEHDAAVELFQEVRRDGASSTQDVNFCHRDGRCIDIEVTASVVRFPSGPVIQRICRDVSDRKNHERELEHHHQLVELVLDLAASFNRLAAAEVSDAITGGLERIGVFLDVHRCYLYVLEADSMSRAYVWGRDKEGRDRWLPPDLRVPMASFEWGLQVLRRGEALEYDLEEDPKKVIEGSDRPAYQRYSFVLPITWGAELVGFMGFDLLHAPRVWDPAQVRLLRMLGYVFGSALQRKQAEEALLRANEELESKVQARTRELRDKQAQLVQTEKMASLGQLVAGVAHELNTPLGTLKSTLQTFGAATRRMQAMIDAPDPVDGARLAKTVAALDQLRTAGAAAVDRVDGLVRGLRSFARLDRAPIDNVDLLEGLQSALDLVRHQVTDRIRVERALTPLPPVECHPDQINQVFMNLLLNAIQAIEGEGVIRVRTEIAAHEVMVEVADDGRGIPTEDLARVFDPGFTTKGVGVGAGLGLSIAHRVVEEHRGRIEIDSTVGAGTAVQVWLPIRHEHAH